MSPYNQSVPTTLTQEIIDDNSHTPNEPMTCKCGSKTHLRTNFSACILNKKNINNLDAGLINQLSKQNKDRINKNRKNNQNTQEYNQFYNEVNADSINYNQQCSRFSNAEHNLKLRNEYRQANKEKINETQNDNNKKNKESAIYKFRDIAKMTNFTMENVFGKYVQIDKNSENYGRHIIPLEI